MPRPMINIKERSTESTLSSLTTQSSERKKNSVFQQEDPKLRERVLRQKRSKRYMDAMCKLDSGNAKLNSNAVEELINVVRAEFPEIEIPGDFLGIISKCYLGEPYEVHTLSLTQSIIKHYKRGEPLPDGMDCARNIAQNNKYAFVEVYTGCIRTVMSDGMVSVIERK